MAGDAVREVRRDAGSPPARPPAAVSDVYAACYASSGRPRTTPRDGGVGGEGGREEIKGERGGRGGAGRGTLLYRASRSSSFVSDGKFSRRFAVIARVMAERLCAKLVRSSRAPCFKSQIPPQREMWLLY